MPCNMYIDTVAMFINDICVNKACVLLNMK